MSRQTVDTTKKPLSRYPGDRYRTARDGVVLTLTEETEARKFGMS